MKTNLITTFTLCFCMLALSARSQEYTVTAGNTALTSSLNDIGLDLTGDWDSTVFFSIERNLIQGSDTLLVYQGSYKLTDADAASFVSFSKDEETGHILLGIGAFEALTSGSYTTVVRFQKSNEDVVELTIND